MSKKLFCEQVNDNQKEYIICSAIWYKDLPLIDADKIPAGHYLPINCDKGIVFAGRNHMQCMYQMILMTGKRDAEAGRKVGGFLTNKNRFVKRKKAREIAINAGQVKEGDTYSKHLLYSEDLFP